MSPKHPFYQATPRWQAELIPNLHVLHALILYVKREVACIISCLPCHADDDNVNKILWRYYFVWYLILIIFKWAHFACIIHIHRALYVLLCFLLCIFYTVVGKENTTKRQDDKIFLFSGIFILLHNHCQFLLLCIFPAVSLHTRNNNMCNQWNRCTITASLNGQK